MLLLICTVLLIFLYIFIETSNGYNYWKQKSVFHIKPTYLFGSLKDVVLRRISMIDLTSFMYHSNENVRYIGVYQFFNPTLIIRDPDLIKEIAVKAFHSFADRTLTVSKKVDPCWAHAVVLKTFQDGWSELRAKITPSFTSQKLRFMVPLIQDSTHNFIDFLKSKSDPIVTMEMKQVFSRIGCDIITNVSFGVLVNSFKSPNNLFYVLGKRSSNFSGVRSLIFTGYSSFPRVMEFFRIRFFNEGVIKFFRNVIQDTLKLRKEKNVLRPDFLHLLTNIDGSNTQLELSDDEIIANSLSFFFAGLESTSHLLTFLAYELALHPEIQDKLYEEINEALKISNGNLTYEAISDMKYFDTVVSEVLRLRSPNFASDRRCVNPYTIQPKRPGEKPLTIDKGVFVWVPIYAIHHDPKYFPNPHKFDPERFNPENKTKIVPNTYIPFGCGPRKCLAERFAILVIKVVFFELIQNYEILRVDKTEVPIKYSADSLFNFPKNGISVGLKRRIQNQL